MVAKYLFVFLFCLVREYTVMFFCTEKILYPKRVIVLGTLRPLDAPVAEKYTYSDYFNHI